MNPGAMHAAGQKEGGSDRKDDKAKGADKGGSGEASEDGKKDAGDAEQKQNGKHEIQGAQQLALAACA